ncbi:hypothetical protein [Nesterenkonia jeotgali]|uniref:Uncharacterized protein n=1 Tax=Nesterenkonia jeotgali TaxID=317018 RepID=A0A0W8IGD1_9MICC|nr:hypothetical protein [Nesterenkonia jeotgali]KUG58968.1 hypothetical protein AVL63_02795 [Nesterenkonia jeotgali]
MRRLYTAICGLIEAHTDTLRQPTSDPHREVDMPGTQAESTGQLQREELDQDANREVEYYTETARLPRTGFTAPTPPRPEEPRP